MISANVAEPIKQFERLGPIPSLCSQCGSALHQGHKKPSTCHRYRKALSSLLSISDRAKTRRDAFGRSALAPASGEAKERFVIEFELGVRAATRKIARRSGKDIIHDHLKHNGCPFEIVTVVGRDNPRRKWLQVLAERGEYAIVQLNRETADERRGRTRAIRMALAREIGDEGHDAQLASIAAAGSLHEFNLAVQSFCLQIDGHLGVAAENLIRTGARLSIG